MPKNDELDTTKGLLSLFVADKDKKKVPPVLHQEAKPPEVIYPSDETLRRIEEKLDRILHYFGIYPIIGEKGTFVNKRR